jgi:hypothetical protein
MAITGIAAVGGQTLSSLLSGKTRVQFKQNGGTLITFDASIKETHQQDCTATEFPIENGKTISDHIIVKPFSLQLTGIITDSPIGGLQAILTEVGVTAASALLPPVGVIGAAGALSLFSALTKSPRRSVANYASILRIAQSGQPVDVLTSLSPQMYKNMWITSLSVPRDAETGNCILFTVSLKQLLLVTPQSVSVSVFANPGLSANKQDIGQESLKSVFQEGEQSGLSKVLSKLPGGSQ